MHLHNRFFLNGAFGIFTAAILVGCNSKGPADTQAAPAAPPPTQVTTLTVSPRDVPVSFEYTGQVAGSHEVEVRSRVSGIIEKRLYDEGIYVKQGKILFLIDDEPLKAQMAEAQATLASANASRTVALAQLKKAKRDYARIMPLAQKKLLSQSASDDAESAVELANATIQQADAAILQAKATIQSVQINLDYTTVKAPISGIAGRAMKMEGSLVQAGSDSLLMTISQTNPAYVNFGIPEPQQIQQQQEVAAKTLKLPSQGFEVELTSSNGQQLDQKGRVNFEDYKIDPQTGNFAVRATIENSNRKLSPGQFVRVKLKGAVRPGAIVVPQRAVLDNPQGKYVYVVGHAKNPEGAENKQPAKTIAEQRPVEVGEWVQLEGDLNNAWIIKSGLKPGDQVVIEGTARIFYPGMPIQSVSAEDAAKAASMKVQSNANQDELVNKLEDKKQTDKKQTEQSTPTKDQPGNTAISSDMINEINSDLKSEKTGPAGIKESGQQNQSAPKAQ